MTLHDAHSGAHLVLRALVDTADPPPAPPDESWPMLARIAAGNGVLVRTADRFRALGSWPPVDLWTSVALERAGARAAVELVDPLTDTCTRLGVEHVFLDALDHYPDRGPDIDLLVAERSRALDTRIMRGVSAIRLAQDMSSRIAGASRYRAWGCEVDIRHARLGTVGEDFSYARAVLARRRRITTAGVEHFVPAAADRVILQGLQRVYARRRIRLANVLLTIACLRDPLPWGEIAERSRALGVWDGLCCYLSYVEQIYGAAFDRPLLTGSIRESLLHDDWGRVAFGENGYRFPALRVNSRLYLIKLGVKLGARRWADAGRLCLLPLLAATTVLPRGVRA